MSQSVPVDAAPAGAELVAFDRPDLPIAQMSESGWADAGREAARDGAPLDRLFGESSEVFVVGDPGETNAAGCAAPVTAAALPVRAGSNVAREVYGLCDPGSPDSAGVDWIPSQA